MLYAALLAHAALNGAATAVEQVVLTAVTYLTLQLQELLETIIRVIIILVIFVLQPRGAGGVVCVSIVSQALGQTSLDVSQDIMLRALNSVSYTQCIIFTMREGGAGGLVVLCPLK